MDGFFFGRSATFKRAYRVPKSYGEWSFNQTRDPASAIDFTGEQLATEIQTLIDTATTNE